METVRPVICWFRRDLRVDDNPALYHAVATGRPVVPIFIVDEELISHIPSDGAVFDFQAECLLELSRSLERLGGNLTIRRGNIRKVFADVVRQTYPVAVYFNRDFEPAAVERDNSISEFLKAGGIEVKPFDDVVIHTPDELKTAEGKPYAVFTPYARKWKQLPKPRPIGQPGAFRSPGPVSDRIPTGRSVGRPVKIWSPAARGGESEANDRWRFFLKGALTEYAVSRDFPGRMGTSMMSPYLRFGCISPLKMYSDLRNIRAGATPETQEAIDKYLDELVWREFYISVLHHFPFTAYRNYRREFDNLNWSFDEKNFESWKEGRTGFPLVDAGMRQLNATGWMHNRVRMVVASFLTKDLLTDWRQGEEYFASMLLDIEKASNVGGWQWSASAGVDPRPLRIFNPVLQSERFDEAGNYIRKWIPELAKVPDKFIHEPVKMTPAMQKDIGLIIGRDYPEPIVDHRTAAGIFRRLYFSVRNDSRRPA